jgi:hypothetical protein
MHSLKSIFKLRYSLAGLFGGLLLLLTTFPYLQLMPSISYTQPNALFLGAFLFFLQGWSVLFRLPLTDQIALIGLVIVGIGTFLFTCFPYINIQQYKYIISYLSPLLLTIPLLRYLRYDSVTALRLLRLSILSWIFIAVIQKFIAPTFLVFLLGEWGGSALDIVQSGRGVLGLAPEPTHHAFHILLLAASLTLLDSNRCNRWLLVLCIVDAVLLAASASAILVIGISGLLWALFYRQRWIIVATILAVILFLMRISEQSSISSDLRIGRVISAVLSNPLALFTEDYSVNMRLGGMIAVFLESINSVFIPRGMSLHAWEIAREEILALFPWLMDLSSVGPPSGIGLLLFQTGLFGAILIGLVFQRILTPGVGMLGRIILLASPIIFLCQYYISAPTFSLLYACALFRLGQKPALNLAACRS